MSWFETLTGIEERSPEQVRSKLRIDGDALVCPSGKRIAFGRLETPSLAELRAEVSRIAKSPGTRLRLSEVKGDVRRLHADAGNANALFQVASQFNLLEMTSPSVIPEDGVEIYEYDQTQGPACAIACGAGTIYRNYFVDLGDQIGQSKDRQIDCARDLGVLLGNEAHDLWQMKNGYLLPTASGLKQVVTVLRAADESQRDQYRASLRIGLQWNADVTLPSAKHRVSQAYCSALPVAYGQHPQEHWTEFASLVLEAAYEATFCAAILNQAAGGSNKLFLTFLGGGVFGNRESWIVAAMERAVERYRDHDLDVFVVSYRGSSPLVQSFIGRHSSLAT